jgi:hypothetical protein
MDHCVPTAVQVDERCLKLIEIERLVVQGEAQAALPRLFAAIAPLRPG